MLSGTRVLSGEGKMLVLVVGDASCVGKIAALLRQDEPEGLKYNFKINISNPVINEIRVDSIGYW